MSEWGFCTVCKAREDAFCSCDGKQISWSELAELTHVTQVERFGFCTCEDAEPHEYPYSDCLTERGLL